MKPNSKRWRKARRRREPQPKNWGEISAELILKHTLLALVEREDFRAIMKAYK